MDRNSRARGTGPRFLVLLTCLLFYGSGAYAQKSAPAAEVVDTSDTGTVNWTKGSVSAIGIGIAKKGTKGAQARVLAREAAIVVAQRNLLAIVQGIQITSTTTVKSLEIESDDIKRSVQGFIRGARVIAEKDLGDGSYQVTVTAPLYGNKQSLAAAVDLPSVLQPEPKPAPETPDNAETAVEPEPQPGPAPEPPAQPVQQNSVEPAPQQGPFTGLLVDCRGLGGSRAMGPRIFDTDSKDVWGFINMDKDVALDKGKVGYYTSADQAIAMGRVGTKPLIVKAVRMIGNRNYPSDAVVTVEDGSRIKAEDVVAPFLSRLAVGFIVDPTRPLGAMRKQL